MYEKLSKDRLKEFYNRGITIINVGDYQIKLGPGIWENEGGVGLYTFDNDNEIIMLVGGKIHRYTNITSIQGKKGENDSINEFKDSLGIHPANLDLLLFLKLSQILDYDKITIRGTASRKYNFNNIDSKLYSIPRNYFRLKANPENNLYEFDGNKRNKLLDKFASKNKTVADAFDSMDAYFNDFNPVIYLISKS